MSDSGLPPSQSRQLQALLQRLSTEQQAAFQRMSAEQKRVFLQQLLQRQQQQQQTQIQEEVFRVFKPEIDSVAHDPLDPGKRYHDGVFVETDRVRGTGKLFHVTGDIIGPSGMRYEERDRYNPDESANFHRSSQIGYVSRVDYNSGRISTVLRALPTPTKQQGLNFWERNPTTGRHDIIWTKEDGEPYGPREQRRPIFKCNEWTALYAIPALRNAGILRDSFR